MNEDIDSSNDQPRPREKGRSTRVSRGRNGNSASSGESGEGNSAPVIDFWSVLDVLSKRWYSIALGALVMGAGSFALGWKFLQPKFTANGQLFRYETPGASDFFGTTPMTGDTFGGLIMAPEVLRRVGQSATPPIPRKNSPRQ